MRDAVCDGAFYARRHIAHRDIGHKATEQERVAVGNRARHGTPAREQPLGMRDMNVPAGHEQSFQSENLRPARIYVLDVDSHSVNI